MLGERGFDALALLAAWLAVDAVLGSVFRSLQALKSESASDLDASPQARPSRPRSLAAITQAPEFTTTVSALMGSGVVLVLATYSGREPLLAAASALFAGALATLLAGDDRPLLTRIMAGIQVSAAWLMGHAALAPLNGGALGLALLVGLAAYARDLAGARPRAARWVLTWAWVILLIASIQGRRPLVTAAVAVGAIADLMHGVQPVDSVAGPWRGVQQRAAWLAATALMAFSATRWG